MNKHTYIVLKKQYLINMHTYTVYYNSISPAPLHRKQLGSKWSAVS